MRMPGNWKAPRILPSLILFFVAGLSFVHAQTAAPPPAKGVQSSNAPAAGYGEGGPSGSQYCNPSSTLPMLTAPAPVVPCSTLPNTAMSGPAYGFTAPRNFHANNLTLGVHYEF